MKQLISVIIVLLGSLGATAQTTWSNGAAEVFYNNCTSCHRPNGIGPFSLLTYEDAAANSSGLDYVVNTGYMPPWHADNSYQSYSGIRGLSSDDIIKITEWVNTGAPAGNLEEAPPAPVYPEDGFIAAEPDLELQIPEYTSSATAWADDYVCFSLPTGLLTDKKIRAFEVIPGNSLIVHHALIYVDDDGDYPTDLSGDCGGPTEGLIGGYTPGSPPTVFPSNGEDINIGYTIPAGSNVVFAMHYPEGSAGETDQTKIRFYFYDDETEIREISTEPIIQNWTFNLPANQISDVNADFNFIPADISVLSVFPHMHLLGKQIESYAVTLADDTIPFVKIPHWDFEWQQFYFFEEIQKVPAWSTVYGNGTYDNTDDNPHNPNDPPANVGAGLNTSDEMFLVYFHYLAYEEGDEDINLEELTALPTFINELNSKSGLGIKSFPNPFDESISIQLDVEQASMLSLYIYDINGRLVEKLVDNENVKSGLYTKEWNPSDEVENGVYYFSIKLNGESQSGMIIKE